MCRRRRPERGAQETARLHVATTVWAAWHSPWPPSSARTPRGAAGWFPLARSGEATADEGGQCLRASVVSSQHGCSRTWGSRIPERITTWTGPSIHRNSVPRDTARDRLPEHVHRLSVSTGETEPWQIRRTGLPDRPSISIDVGMFSGNFMFSARNLVIHPKYLGIANKQNKLVSVDAFCGV